MAEKKARRQFTAEQKHSLVAEVDKLRAQNTPVKVACAKLGFASGLYDRWKRELGGTKGQPFKLEAPKAPAASGAKASLPIEERRKLVERVLALKAQGTPIKHAVVTVGIKTDDYFRWKKQIEKAAPGGTNLPAVRKNSTTPAKQLEMMQFDLGPNKRQPMVLMIGDAEDFKSTLSQLGQLLRGE